MNRENTKKRNNTRFFFTRASNVHDNDLVAYIRFEYFMRIKYYNGAIIKERESEGERHNRRQYYLRCDKVYA